MRPTGDTMPRASARATAAIRTGDAPLNHWSRACGPLDLFFDRDGVLPLELQAALLGFVPEPEAPGIESSGSVPEVLEVPRRRWDPETRESFREIDRVPVTITATEVSARNDLLAVLRLVDRGEVGASPRTRIASAAGQRAIAGILDGGDFHARDPGKGNGRPPPEIGPIKAFAWPLILQAAGLAEVAGSRLRLTPRGRKALGRPPAETLRDAWSRWRKVTFFDELRRVEAIKGQQGKGKRALTALGGRRAAIAEALRACPRGRWVAVEELLRYLVAADLAYEVSTSPWYLYISDAQYGSLGYDGHGWSLLRDRYARAVLLEYAATLGLLDVALAPPDRVPRDFDHLWGTDELPFLSRYDGLLSIRVTPLGAYVLGTAAVYEAPEEASPTGLAVLATLEVVLPDEAAPAADRLTLDRYAERVSDRVWRLDRGRILEALGRGHPVSELREFLEVRTSESLPPTVDRLLRDAEEKVGQLETEGPALLVACRDAELAALIAHDRGTRNLCLPAGERHLAVPVASERRFRKALRGMGLVLPETDT
jgi:hypothetical protein